MSTVGAFLSLELFFKKKMSHHFDKIFSSAALMLISLASSVQADTFLFCFAS